MTYHNICDACETVAHCSQHGCIPIQESKKPCRSPYCECVPGQCQHPGCYDARSEPWTHPYNPAPDVRELAKWLNEEPNRDLNRQALARVLAYLQTHQ